MAGHVRAMLALQQKLGSVAGAGDEEAAWLDEAGVVGEVEDVDASRTLGQGVFEFIQKGGEFHGFSPPDEAPGDLPGLACQNDSAWPGVFIGSWGGWAGNALCQQRRWDGFIITGGRRGVADYHAALR